MDVAQVSCMEYIYKNMGENFFVLTYFPILKIGNCWHNEDIGLASNCFSSALLFGNVSFNKYITSLLVFGWLSIIILKIGKSNICRGAVSRGWGEILGNVYISWMCCGLWSTTHTSGGDRSCK